MDYKNLLKKMVAEWLWAEGGSVQDMIDSINSNTEYTLTEAEATALREAEGNLMADRA